jgi:nitrogen regulatory protein PII
MALKFQLQKVTIIAERVLREELLALLKRHGAKGWTLASVEGEGSRGIRASEWEGFNVQIDTLVSDEIAESIMEEIGRRYFKDWSIIVYAAPVQVLRGDKYLPKS